MTRIKIYSNPYYRSIYYKIYNDNTSKWDNIEQNNEYSKLRENDGEKTFLPFKIKDIMDTIISEYYVGTEKVQIVFEGTSDEYEEVRNACEDDSIKDKVVLTRSVKILENARDIISYTKEIFDDVYPSIKSIIKNDENVSAELDKVSEALNDVIPICIFGNYSAGKSTFINALIGYEILPSGGDPVTAKVFEIRRSKYQDRSKVNFVYLDEKYVLIFDNDGCRVELGRSNADIVIDVLSNVQSCSDKRIFAMVNKSIELLNSFEKRYRKNGVLGDVIGIEVPFSNNGILGHSHNEFVIFDTPGSNSQSNVDHKKILTSALEGFSNGIPVWVSQYDSIDSVDNKNLCDKLSDIEALDKRFTMIVVNKADSVELPKNGLSDEDVKKILEYDAVEKMYSSGIFFVSSIMGIGAKNYEGIVSDYILDVFEEKENKFSNSSARSYKQLYLYNIMPSQIKAKSLIECEQCENKIYANSGMLCIEDEMDQFASKYAAYNKCQMVNNFFNRVIKETSKRIENRTKRLENDKVKKEKEMDVKKAILIDSVEKETERLKRSYEREFKNMLESYIDENISYELSIEEVQGYIDTFEKESEKETNYETYVSEYEYARLSRKANLKENLIKPLRRDLIETLKMLATDWSDDSNALQTKKSELNNLRRKMDISISDSMMEKVIEMFKLKTTEAQKEMVKFANERWTNYTFGYRDSMIKLVAESETLSDKHKNQLSEVIMKYKAIPFDDSADKIFIKQRFLRGNILGLNIGKSEKLDIKKLVSSYNSKMESNIKTMRDLLKESCYNSFELWQKNLRDVIENNITFYNPELMEISEFIKDDVDAIMELRSIQLKIQNSYDLIEQMMGWKEI